MDGWSLIVAAAKREDELVAMIAAADASGGDTLALQQEKERLHQEKQTLAEQLSAAEKGKEDLVAVRRPGR
eukprot:COSAG06_NODE_1463_length_9379_cov_25.004849_8_plen_71_part_00